jgi:hypothetical protein
MRRPGEERFGTEAGIAIGPILFIIAILGILAAAIAAGSGTFTSSTNSESSKTKAAALIQIGENLKIGMDRLMLENDITFSNVVIGLNNTVNTVDLFSPTGGGITIPATSMALDPVNDPWYYPTAMVPQLGTGVTSGLEDRLAMIQVDNNTCDQINQKASAVNTNVANYDLGNFNAPNNVNTFDMGNLLGNGDWPAALNGQLTGCIYNGSTYWFYQVLAIQ